MVHILLTLYDHTLPILLYGKGLIIGEEQRLGFLPHEIGIDELGDITV